MSEKQPHPHFDDRGTLNWHTKWSSAVADAKASGKKIFIDFGRESCSQCRSLVQGVVPHAAIAPLLQAGFVALASDCDDPEDEVVQLAQQIPDAMMLPFVIFADSNGKFLEGSSGLVDPKRFQQRLQALSR